MHYPKLKENQQFYENKIGFSVLASAVLMNLLKKQRDAVGLSVFSDNYEYYAPEKGSDRHHRMILSKLEDLLETAKRTKTNRYGYVFTPNCRKNSSSFYDCFVYRYVSK